MKQWLESLFLILLGPSSQDSLCSSLDRARGHMVLFKLYLATVWNTRYYGANKSFLWEDILWRFPGCFFAVWSKEFVWKILMMFQVLIHFLQKVKEFEPKSNFFPFVAFEYGIMNHQSLQNQHFNQLSTWWKLGCPHIPSFPFKVWRDVSDFRPTRVWYPVNPSFVGCAGFPFDHMIFFPYQLQLFTERTTMPVKIQSNWRKAGEMQEGWNRFRRNERFSSQILGEPDLERTALLKLPKALVQPWEMSWNWKVLITSSKA